MSTPTRNFNISNSPDLPKAIFNTEKSDYSEASIILGEQPGILDSIHDHYPDLFEIYKRLRKLDWDEQEFDFSSCMVDFETCDKSTYDMMIKTLAWQWEADSMAARTISSVLGPVITDSKVWAAYLRISENECLIEGTEALTPRGWVDLADLTEDDLVMQYDSNAKEMTFVKPTAYIEKDFKGNLIQFKNHHAHMWQIVTPGHRMVRESLTDGEIEISTADNFSFSRGAAARGWSSIATGTMKHLGKEMRGTLNHVERMLIAIQADGSVSDRYTGELSGHIPVNFCFTRVRKIKRLKSLARILGWELKEFNWNTYNTAGNKSSNFKLLVPVEFKSDLKNLDWVTLEDKNSYWCKDFLEEVINWDGHWTKNTGIYDSIDVGCVEKVQAVASMAGYRTHYRLAGEPKRESHNQLYRVTWKNTAHVSGQGIDKTLVPYEGKVRCVTVPTGLFLIRYNGAVSVTGNCVHALTYSEIVRNSFKNPNVILDEILAVQEAQGRMYAVANVMDTAYHTSYAYALGQRENDESTYNDMFMFLVALYFLERIQFMASFSITFAICKTGWFQPIGHAVKKIAQDEFEIHAQYGQGVLRALMATPRGRKAYEQCKPKMIELFTEVLTIETEWIEYMFSEGRSLPGVNAKKIVDWTLFNANAARTFLGFKDSELTEFADNFTALTGDVLVWPTTNPLPYMEEYMDISASQSSPQEEKSKSDYQVNLMDSREEDDEFDFDM